MDHKEIIITQELASAEKVNSHEDVKSLWDRWDQTRQEEGPSDLVKGYNLLGVGLIIAGAMFQTFGSGFLRETAAPLVVLAGAVILAVKKFKALWLQNSVDR
jgi:hypothetical protein